MSEEAKKNKYDYYVDAKRYETDQTALTGAQIKASASVNPSYQLFLEEQGDHPDKAVPDSEVVDMRHDPHFYAVPPATFGRQ